LGQTITSRDPVREAFQVTDYLWLFSGGAMPPTVEERTRAMRAWQLWFEVAGHAVRDAGNPFALTARSVSGDGSVIERPAETTGYLVVEADSMDEAIELARRCPALETGTKITVFETFEAM
jgi:hypothetical protein